MVVAVVVVVRVVDKGPVSDGRPVVGGLVTVMTPGVIAQGQRTKDQ